MYVCHRQVLDGDDWRPKVAALRQLQGQLAAAEGTMGVEDSRDVVHFMVRARQQCAAQETWTRLY